LPGKSGVTGLSYRRITVPKSLGPLDVKGYVLNSWIIKD
jgi:hypothetical protein